MARRPVEISAPTGRRLRSPAMPSASHPELGRVHLRDRVPPDVARRRAVRAQLHGVADDEFRPDVEGLRALAVVAVVLFHLRLGAFQGGFVGVDVFFVLSGFLITRLLLKELASTGTLSLPGFWARRARRLLPASCLVLVVTLIGGALVLSPLAQRTLAVDAMAAGVFVVNFVFAGRFGDYFAAQLAEAQPSALLHYWSLAVEEQFYLLWPLLLVGLTRRPRQFRRLLLTTILVVAAASLIISIWMTENRPTWAFYLLPSRMVELLAGAALAAAGPAFRAVNAELRAALGWFGVLGIGVAVMTYDLGTVFPGYMQMLPVLGDGVGHRRRRGEWVGAGPGHRPASSVGVVDRQALLRDLPVALAGARPRRGEVRTVALADPSAPRGRGGRLVGRLVAPARGPSAPLDDVGPSTHLWTRPRGGALPHGGGLRRMVAGRRRAARLGRAGRRSDVGATTGGLADDDRRTATGDRWGDHGPDGCGSDDDHRAGDDDGAARQWRPGGPRSCQSDGARAGARAVRRTVEPAPFVARCRCRPCRGVPRRLRRCRASVAAQRVPIRRHGRRVHDHPLRRLPCRAVVSGARGDGQRSSLRVDRHDQGRLPDGGRDHPHGNAVAYVPDLARSSGCVHRRRAARAAPRERLGWVSQRRRRMGPRVRCDDATSSAAGRPRRGHR